MRELIFTFDFLFGKIMILVRISHKCVNVFLNLIITTFFWY